jgi:hypothetical protein
MDFPLPAEYIPYVIGAIFLVIALVVLYEMQLKQVFQLPLMNEQDLGIGKIWLEKMGRFREGRITTAKNTIAGLFTTILTNPESQPANAVGFRERMDKRYFLAMRDGREKLFLMFDANPMDERYCHREDRGSGTPVFSIGPVQDCGSQGVYDKFEWIWVKLDKESKPFPPDVLPHLQVELETLKFMRQSATNISKLKVSEERNKALEEKSDRDNRLIAETTAKLDRALDMGKQQLLSQGPAGMKPPGTTIQSLKQWFSPWQFLIAVLAYLLAPWIIQTISPESSPPATSYLAIVIAVIGFFLLPFAKKLFGRLK